MELVLSGPESVIVEWSGASRADAPLVVLMHGWGENEHTMISLVPSLPIGPTYASVRAPYQQGRHYTWFAPGRPFEKTVNWFLKWLDVTAPSGRPVVLLGFSAGAAFAAGALLVRPERYAGVAILNGTLPFDAGVATPPGGLAESNVFLVHSTDDDVIPPHLLERTWKYLTQESGARTRAERYQGGHAVSKEALDDLALWIAEVTFLSRHESPDREASP